MLALGRTTCNSDAVMIKKYCMRKLIVDTSIIIALISSDEERSVIMQAIANYKMVCSISVYAEVGNAISAMFKRGRITLIQAHEMLNSFKQLRYKMSIYTYEEAYQHFAQLLEEAKNTTVTLKNLKGEMFAIQFISPISKPTKPNLTREEIVSYIRETRER